MDWNVIPDNLGFLLKGLGVTLRLALIAMVLSFALGIIAGIARLARRPWVHLPAVLYIELVRGVPLIMVIFWFYFFIPIITGRPMDNFGSALIAFVVFEGAYMAEIVRAGIQSVPRGQVDAALSTNLTTPQMMRYVILPQALRNMLPSLVTQFIVLFKDTSLAYIIGVIELTRAASIVSQREIRPFELYVFIAMAYWVFAFGLSRLSRLLENRLSHRV
ncbi:MAG: amino acid ABC transporter permease [Candidatus Tectomicrobia bacterium]|uniref:Glutamate/aspartate import permease protein GltK n=1 Tax=Tectimicrobiota bacterium TaxID=2528274 RepID=A0A932GN80_UNCTE|nr:amino acid ABC transporter permease [Candidatus Tectomicrobia bacterium]